MGKRVVLIYLVISLFLLIGEINPEIVNKIVVKEKIYSDLNRSQNVIVITGKELEKFRIRSLSTLLGFLPGVTVARRGSDDSSFDLSMQGGNFEQISVQLDGNPLNNPQTGHFNSDIPITINDIERIVVTRGTDLNSSTSGVSGTINIILKKNKKPKLSFTGGDKKYFSMDISQGLTIKDFIFRLSGGRKNSSGFYKGNEFSINNFLAYTGYRHGIISANLTVGIVDKDLGAENFYAPFPSLEKINSLYSNFLIKRKSEKSEIRFSYMKNIHKDNFILDRYNRSYYENSSITEMDYLKLTGLLNKKKSRFSLGTDFTIEKMDSTAMGYVKRNKGGLFFNFNAENKRWSFDGGLRVDIFPGEEMKILYNFNLLKKISSRFSFNISLGKKVRIPSFTELYYNSPANAGNRDLKNETIYNHQVMISFYGKEQIFNLSLFYRKQRNLIDWIRGSGTVYWEASNICNGDISGFEISYVLNLQSGGVRSSFERIFAGNRSSYSESKYGFRFPDNLVKINLFYRISEKMDFSALYTYKKVLKTSVKGHFLDLSLSVPVNKYRITLHGDNLFNTIIEEIPGIKVPGRWIYVSFSLLNN